MSFDRIIKLANRLENKYAQEVNEDVAKRHSISFLNDVVNGTIEYGKSQAQKLISIIDTGFKSKDSATYISYVIGNMILQKRPLNDIQLNINQILNVLQDPILEPIRDSIPRYIQTYKSVLGYFDNNSEAASNGLLKSVRNNIPLKQVVQEYKAFGDYSSVYTADAEQMKKMKSDYERINKPWSNYSESNPEMGSISEMTSGTNSPKV